MAQVGTLQRRIFTTTHVCPYTTIYYTTACVLTWHAKPARVSARSYYDSVRLQLRLVGADSERARFRVDRYHDILMEHRSKARRLKKK
jgi:hypothetical protein